MYPKGCEKWNELIHMKCLLECLTHSKYLISFVINYYCYSFERVIMSGLVFCRLASFWHHLNITINGKSSLLMDMWSSDMCVGGTLLFYPSHRKTQFQKIIFIYFLLLLKCEFGWFSILTKWFKKDKINNTVQLLRWSILEHFYHSKKKPYRWTVICRQPHSPDNSCFTFSLYRFACAGHSV